MTSHACPLCGQTHHIPNSDPVCACGHPEISHHMTPSKRRTRCQVWNPGACLCQSYTERDEKLT